MLAKIILREIKSSITRYLAVFAIMALGVGLFTGLKMCRTDMVDTADEYLTEHNFYDYEILTSYGVDDDSVKLAEKTEGVTAAEVSVQKDILIEVDRSDGEHIEGALKAISVPEEINTLRLVSGRMPEKDNECVIDNYNMLGTDYKIGDVIKISANNSESDTDWFKCKKYKVVGKVNSPLYLDYERGSTSIGDGSIDTFFYINRSSFDVEYGTQMYVKLDGNVKGFTDEYTKQLSSYEKSMEKLAEKVALERKSVAQEEANEKLNEKRAEYAAAESKFYREKASATNKLSSSKNQAISGMNILNQNESQLRLTISDLERKKAQVQDGYAQVNAKKASLQQQYQSGQIEYAEYEIAMIVLNKTVEELDTNMAQINDGLAQANEAMQTINSKRSEVGSGVDKIHTSEKAANSKFNSAQAQLDRGKAALDDAEAQIAEMETGTSYALSRDNNTGYSTLVNNTDIVSDIAKIFPLFFFLVAALVCMTTMTRMIDEQRSQIGSIRALGYKNKSIRNMYLFYAGSASLLGSVVGFLVGCRVFPFTVWKAYSIMYNFSPSVNYLIDWKLCILATAVAVLCSLLATWSSCSREFKEVPAELVRPKSPPAGKKILLEKWTGLWNKLSFMRKVSLRNVFRYKKRLLMMVLGISGCTALLVAGFGIRTTITGVGERQFTEITKYDYQIAFNQDMDADKKEEYIKFVEDEGGKFNKITFVHQGTATIAKGDFSKEVALIATDEENFYEYMDLNLDGSKVDLPDKGEVLMCRKMRDVYGLKIGDKVTVKDGYYQMTATVAGFYDNYVDENILMSKETYSMLGKDAADRFAFVLAPKGATQDEINEQATIARQSDKVATVVRSYVVIDRISTMMESLNAVVYIIILCAGMLALIVQYNLTNINIIERIREIATIKVLGFYKKETAQYVFRENYILAGIGAIVGLPLGKLLLNYIIAGVQLEQIYYLPRINAIDYVIAVVITFIFTVLVSFIMKPKLGKVSMTESLKTVE